MRNAYRTKEWRLFRDRIIERDGFRCRECGRGRSDGVKLQVHHVVYIPNRKPWEYPDDACETLCAGCHARHHRIIRPNSGWTFEFEDDLGDLAGSCEWCGNNIRYVFYISHRDWSPMEVGTICCDRLTGDNCASQVLRDMKKIAKKRDEFFKTRWVNVGDSRYKLENYYADIYLINTKEGYCFEVNGIVSKKTYETVDEAKVFLYSSINDGNFDKYLRRNRSCRQVMHRQQC